MNILNMNSIVYHHCIQKMILSIDSISAYIKKFQLSINTQNDLKYLKHCIII